MLGDSYGGLRGGRIVADDDGPGANFPMFDKTVEDVGVVLRERGGGVRGGGAASDEIADYFVEEGEIRHGDFLARNRVSR